MLPTSKQLSPSVGSVLAMQREQQPLCGAQCMLEAPVALGTGAGDSSLYSVLCLANELAESAPGLYQNQGFVWVMQSR